MGMGVNPHLGQGNMFPSMGIDRQNLPNQIKKMPNPANFKIVKCKNYEAGISNIKLFKIILNKYKIKK
jgi:hypothetical protein